MWAYQWFVYLLHKLFKTRKYKEHRREELKRELAGLEAQRLNDELIAQQIRELEALPSERLHELLEEYKELLKENDE